MIFFFHFHKTQACNKASLTFRIPAQINVIYNMYILVKRMFVTCTLFEFIANKEIEVWHLTFKLLTFDLITYIVCITEIHVLLDLFLSSRPLLYCL